MAPRKKIALISHDFELQGAQRVLLGTALLLRQKYEVVVIGLKQGPLQREYEAYGIKTITEMSAYRESRLHTFDCIIFNTLVTYSLLATYTSDFLKKKCMLWIHESERDVYEEAFQFDASIFKSLRHTLFVSAATQKIYSDLIEQHASSVIHYPLDISVPGSRAALAQRMAHRNQYGIPLDATMIVTTGAVIKRKGQDDFLRAVLPLLQSHPLLYIGIVGFSGVDQAFENHIHWMVKTSGYSERIILVPQTHTIAPWYIASDIFGFFSYIESMPVVIAEAMLYGLPVIATGVYGVSEQILHKKTGMLVPAGDTHAFTEALEFLIQHKEYAKNMARDAQKRARKMFSSSVFQATLVKIIEKHVL